jgi:predicted ATPase
MLNMMDSDRMYIITGGPGSGKSTLVDALENIGYTRSVEAGRAIIQSQLKMGGNALPWTDPGTFAEWMLCWEINSYFTALKNKDTVIFDRGIPDIISYLRFMNLPVPEYMVKAVELFLYNKKVFIAPPWEEIFVQDEERKQTFQESRLLFDSLVNTYSFYGYELVPLPLESVAMRCRFFKSQIGD